LAIIFDPTLQTHQHLLQAASNAHRMQYTCRHDPKTEELAKSGKWHTL
jgi:hypothetical protein